MKFRKLISSLFTLLGNLSPLVVNLFYTRLFYLAVQRHAYAYVAAGAVYLVLSELDSIKRDIALYRR